MRISKWEREIKDFVLSHHGEWCHSPTRLVPGSRLRQAYWSLRSLSAMTQTHWEHETKKAYDEAWFCKNFICACFFKLSPDVLTLGSLLCCFLWKFTEITWQTQCGCFDIAGMFESIFHFVLWSHSCSWLKLNTVHYTNSSSMKFFPSSYVIKKLKQFQLPTM